MTTAPGDMERGGQPKHKSSPLPPPGTHPPPPTPTPMKEAEAPDDDGEDQYLDKMGVHINELKSAANAENEAVASDAGVDNFPDAGLRAWSVVLGVSRSLLSFTYAVTSLHD
jgi:hypothetical protein